MFDQPDGNDATRPVHTGAGETTKPTQIHTSTDSTQPVPASTGVTIPVHPGAGEARTVPIWDGPGAVPLEPDPQPELKPKRIVGRIILLGILVVLMLASLGGWLGYMDGLNARKNQQASVVAMEAATQFQMGMQNMAEGRLDVAKTRFEYVISIDPTFPGVKEKLAEVLFTLAKQTNPTATFEPTLTQMPTPDTSNEETQWKYVLQQMAAKNWDGAINGMDGLRKINLKYKPVEVDGLYFIALRFRGIDKMLKYADLEGGIYDLSQAEKFAAIDRDADGWRTYARLYLTGAAYWEVNWENAVEYFAQVAPALPNLRDSSGMTAIERYRIAVSKLAENYIKDDGFCKASKLYESLIALQRNSAIEPTATWLANKCNPPTKTPTPRTPTSTPTITTSGTVIGLSATPSPTGGVATSTLTPLPPTVTKTPVPPSRTPTK